jgi:hypothetical protein
MGIIHNRQGYTTGEANPRPVRISCSSSTLAAGRRLSAGVFYPPEIKPINN